ncbi:hypothetical protein [Halorubrum salsamenti]|uniref:hypothetical protein n=1 Tax=Halorubrum salsamenti TaxID=2583990 RepID=UPI001F4F5F1A|nr:hypothetical protein [Halorubrum salsamenti]
MTVDVEPDDWARLDPWVDAYLDAGSGVSAYGSDRQRVLRDTEREWEAIDALTQTGEEPASSVVCSAALQVTNPGGVTQWWGDLDPWWETFTATGHQTAVEVGELLDRSNELWAASDAPFETDPLAADISGSQGFRGPLRPNGELDWSQWLAQLLQPSAALVSELFDESIEAPPDEVRREVQLPKQNGGWRQADILVRHPEYGVSIEVKLGDENYRKTPETASLIERHFDDVQWDHVLLLPKRQRGRLETIVSPPIEASADGRREVKWDDPGPITVLYWLDIAAAVRSVLRRGDIVDDHWAANAYLFCAAIEQYVAGFQPQPMIERMVDPAGVVETVRPIAVSGTLDEQLTYLRARVSV